MKLKCPLQAVPVSLQTVEEEEPEEEDTTEDAEKEKEEEEEEDAKVEEEEEEKEKKTKKVSKTVWDWELMNSVKPIWTRKYVRLLLLQASPAWTLTTFWSGLFEARIRAVSC